MNVTVGQAWQAGGPPPSGELHIAHHLDVAMQSLSRSQRLLDESLS